MNRKKKLPVVTLADREEAASVVASLPAEATIALADIGGAIRDGLMAFCCSAGLLAVRQVMDDEMTAKVGPRGDALADSRTVTEQKEMDLAAGTAIVQPPLQSHLFAHVAA